MKAKISDEDLEAAFIDPEALPKQPGPVKPAIKFVIIEGDSSDDSGSGDSSNSSSSSLK